MRGLIIFRIYCVKVEGGIDKCIYFITNISKSKNNPLAAVMRLNLNSANLSVKGVLFPAATNHSTKNTNLSYCRGGDWKSGTPEASVKLL